MENPYHKAEWKPHYLDKGQVKAMCFDVFNIIAASGELAGRFEMEEPDVDVRESTLFKLHHELAEARLSQAMLQLAVFLRTYEDTMATSDKAESYLSYARDVEEGPIGELNGEKLTFRDACNKIIHAQDFRPVYDHVDRSAVEQPDQRAWHLTGEVELLGIQGSKEWSATVWVQEFLEAILDRLEFEFPAA